MAGDLDHLFELALLFSLARETASKIHYNQWLLVVSSVDKYVVPAIEQLKRASDSL